MVSDPGSPVKKPTRDAILTITPSVTKKTKNFMRNTADQSAFRIMDCVGSNILNENADWSVVWGQYGDYVTGWRHARDDSPNRTIFGESFDSNFVPMDSKKVWILEFRLNHQIRHQK